jgi:hypothetical protein
MKGRQRVLTHDRLARELLAVVAPADLDDHLPAVADRVDEPVNRSCPGLEA